MQYRVAHERFAGAAQVTGGPGTGKTVVVLHRAKVLAERGRRMLLTTFTTTLANALYEQLRLLVTDDAVLDRIEVRDVDQVAHRIVADAHGRPAVLSRDEERQLWRRVARRTSVTRTEAFLSEEWRRVVLAQKGLLRAAVAAGEDDVFPPIPINGSTTTTSRSVRSASTAPAAPSGCR